MNEDKIKSLRGTFSTSCANEFMAPQKNKFGHTVLNSSDRNINEDSTDVTIDEQGLVVASPKYSVFDSQEFNEFAEKFTEISKAEVEPEKISVNNIQGADFQKLLSELDEMDGKKIRSTN